MARYANEEYEGLEYLELRKRLKEEIRNKLKKESGTASSSRNNKSSSSKDNFGSFFGPSQPVIAQRVIEESKALLENPDLAAKVMRASNSNIKAHDFNSVRPDASVNGIASKVSNGAKAKLQEVRNARDYSFLLSDDAPAPQKPSLPKKISAPNPASLPARSLPRDANLSSSIKKNIPSSHQVRRPLPGDRQVLKQRPVSTGKQILPARETRKEPIRSNMISRSQPLAQRNLPSKSSAGVTMRKASTSDMRRPLPNMQRSNPSKQHPPTISKQALVPKKPSQESSKPRTIQRPTPAKLPSKPNVVTQKRPIPSSKPQMRQQTAIKNPDRRPAKRQMPFDEEDSGDDYASTIRKMFGYNPNKYCDYDDDDSNMEASFGEIEREEMRSARIAKREDEEELRKIEEEERRQRMKKRKLK